MLFVLRYNVACRSCSILKSSTVKLRRIILCIIKSSLRYLAGGDLNAEIVSHIPLQDFRNLADPKHDPTITSATLNTTLMPSHKKQSQIRNSVSHGNVRVIAHKNQSVIFLKKNKKEEICWFGSINFFFHKKIYFSEANLHKEAAQRCAFLNDDEQKEMFSSAMHATYSHHAVTFPFQA